MIITMPGFPPSCFHCLFVSSLPALQCSQLNLQNSPEGLYPLSSHTHARYLHGGMAGSQTTPTSQTTLRAIKNQQGPAKTEKRKQKQEQQRQQEQKNETETAAAAAPAAAKPETETSAAAQQQQNHITLT